MKRQDLIERLKAYDSEGVPEVGHALELLAKSSEYSVSNEEIGDVLDRVSKAIDRKYSDDDAHDAYSLEAELAAAYQQ
jgi:predicted amino acid racemase